MWGYEILFGRNFPLIEPKDQERMKSLKVAIVGLGALSFVAEYLARLGVEKFVLIDGDKVEAQNINHQHYTLSDVGKNKAQALSEYLSEINPETKAIALPTFLQEQNFDEIWNRYLYNADVIVDGIDPVPGILVSKKLAQKCKEQNIIYLYPLDLGNGALLFANAERLEMLLEGKEPLEILFSMLSKLPHFNLNFPAKIYEIIEKVAKGELKYYPQTIIAAVTASLLTVAVILRIIECKKPPFLVYCDPTEGSFQWIE